MGVPSMRVVVLAAAGSMLFVAQVFAGDLDHRIAGVLIAIADETAEPTYRGLESLNTVLFQRLGLSPQYGGEPHLRGKGVNSVEARTFATADGTLPFTLADQLGAETPRFLVALMNKNHEKPNLGTISSYLRERYAIVKDNHDLVRLRGWGPLYIGTLSVIDDTGMVWFAISPAVAEPEFTGGRTADGRHRLRVPSKNRGPSPTHSRCAVRVTQRKALDIVVGNNQAKFEQNEALGGFLANTGNRVLAEASPRDRICGLGLSVDDSRAQNPIQWRGENLLGFALMEVGSGWAVVDPTKQGGFSRHSCQWARKAPMDFVDSTADRSSVAPPPQGGPRTGGQAHVP